MAIEMFFQQIVHGRIFIPINKINLKQNKNQR